MTQSTDVFISYSHHDRVIAEHISGVLEGYGFSVWWDHALLAGINFRTQITEKIIESNVVLVLFSNASINSGWVLDEAGRADQANKLIPIRVSPVEIPLGFGQLHYCDLMDWEKGSSAAIDQIILAVEHRIGKARNEAFVVPEVVETLTEPSDDELSGTGRDRFKVSLIPDHSIRSVLVLFAPVYLLALLVALMRSGGFSFEAFKEWVSLLHAYTGMITLGGGIFLTIMFRLGDEPPTNTERAAIADVARKLFVVWRVAAIGQLLTGCILIWLTHWTLREGWIYQSLLFYAAALNLWWVGFEHALRAAKYDSLYQVGEHIQDARAMRNRRLMWALLATAWVLVLMIYREDADIANVFKKFMTALGMESSE